MSSDCSPCCESSASAFVPYAPLGRGFLTGTAKPADQYDESDMRSFDQRWQPGAFERNVEAVRQLEAFANERGAKVSQLALAWLLAQGDDIVPISRHAQTSRGSRRMSALPTWSFPTTTCDGSPRSFRPAVRCAISRRGHPEWTYPRPPKQNGGPTSTMLNLRIVCHRERGYFRKKVIPAWCSTSARRIHRRR